MLFFYENIRKALCIFRSLDSLGLNISCFLSRFTFLIRSFLLFIWFHLARWSSRALTATKFGIKRIFTRLKLRNNPSIRLPIRLESMCFLRLFLSLSLSSNDSESEKLIENYNRFDNLIITRARACVFTYARIRVAVCAEHITAISNEFSYFQRYSWRLAIACKRASAARTWNWWVPVTRTRYFSTRVSARDLSSIDFRDTLFKSRYFYSSIAWKSQFARGVYQVLYWLFIRFPFASTRK